MSKGRTAIGAADRRHQGSFVATADLLDIRDALAAAKNLAGALHMACDARSMPRDQRAALCEASNVLRERLEALVVTLDQMLATARA